MEPLDLLAYVARILDEQEMQYLVTGSMATILYGEPRLTNDIDIVVVLTPKKIERFCGRFPADQFCLSREAVADAVANCGQFNIIHPASGLKIDVMIPDDNPFNRSRLQRGQIVEVITGADVSFASAEDVIIKKMEYFKLGGSDKHLRDIAGVLTIGKAEIDRIYIQDWAARLGLTEVWAAVLKQADA